MPSEKDALPTYYVNSDESPEEGEILSDNHLEDISSEESYDDMDFVPIGKSIRNNQHLHALCLSSVSSDNSSSTHPRSRRKRQNHHRGHEHRGHCKRRRTCKKRRDSSTSSISSDDQEDTTLDIRLKAQLKAAVKFDLIENAHKNSLRTRLKAMVSCPVNGEPKSDTELIHDTIEIIASGSEHTEEHTIDTPEDTPKIEDLDDDLIQLRLAALKTAICNKYAKRTKKKNDMNKENTTVEQAPQAQTNKENKIDNADNESNIPPAPSIEEDEDVLRAILLASMSKKITSYQPETVTEPIINNKNLKINNFNNVNKAFNNAQKNIKVPQVKPLIIRINSDSEDSDWDLSQEKSPEKKLLEPNYKIVAEKPVREPQENGVKCSDELQEHGEVNLQQLSAKNPKCQEEALVQKNVENNIQKNLITSSDNLTKNNNKLLEENSKKPQDNATIVTKNGITNLEIAKIQEAKALIESSVEKFLKEQRAKVESRQNLKSHPKKITVNFKPQPKKNPLNIKAQPKKNPHSLKIQLKKNSQHKPKLSPNSPDLEKSAIKFLPANKMEEYQKLQSLLKQKRAQKLLLTKNKLDKATQVVKNSKPENSRTGLENEDFESGLLKRKKEKQSCSSVLRATLKQLEMKNSNGRFQIQDKYKDLRPLIRDINQLNKEQKQCEQNVDRLVEELAQARQKQEELHRKMLTSVTNLADEKKKIDLSSLKPVIVNKAPTIISAPIKTSLIKSNSTLASTITPHQKLISEKSDLKIVNQITNKGHPKDGTENEATNPINIDKVIEKTEEKLAALKQLEGEIRKKKKSECKLPLDSCQSALKPVKPNNAPITSTPIKSSLPTATMSLLASAITSDQSLVCDKSETSIFDQTTIQNDQLLLGDTKNKIRDLEKTRDKVEVSKETKQCDDVKKEETSGDVLPLDQHERQTPWNPVLIICPFQMNGTCKDSECTYNHFQK